MPIILMKKSGIQNQDVRGPTTRIVREVNYPDRVSVACPSGVAYERSIQKIVSECVEYVTSHPSSHTCHRTRSDAEFIIQ